MYSRKYWQQAERSLPISFTRNVPSLRSWRYCVGARLKFLRRSGVPKKGSRDEAVEVLLSWSISRGFAARDSSAVKSHSNILQRLRRQMSLDYYTIPPAAQARMFLVSLLYECKCLRIDLIKINCCLKVPFIIWSLYVLSSVTSELQCASCRVFIALAERMSYLL